MKIFEIHVQLNLIDGILLVIFSEFYEFLLYESLHISQGYIDLLLFIIIFSFINYWR